MTRFARAKGSKASNERLPEEATTWNEMKQQLLEKNREIEESKKRKEALEKRKANYQAFLDEREENKTNNTSWAEFPESSDSAATPRKNKVKSSDTANKPIDEKIANQNELIFSTLESDGDEAPEEQSSKKEIVEPVAPKKKKVKSKKLLKIILPDDKGQIDNNVDPEVSSKPTKKRKAAVSETEEVISKKKKKIDKNKNSETSPVDKPKKNKPKKVIKEDLTEQDIKKIEKKKMKRIKQLEKKKRLKAELKKQKEEVEQKTEENSESQTSEVQVKQDNETTPFEKPLDKGQENNANQNKPFNKANKSVEKKNKKVKDNEEHTRRKPQMPHKMFINGKELEIEYIDGFPVKKEDAVRLKKLRREMISKGLPRSEINIALKLERRKAEKAFAREKKKVCFHCRKSGHNLSECPNIDKNEVTQTIASGICFKCGSTEHTHFECKVVRGQEFKYASCFICQEQGHIARQCPDNARGLYPKGGACRVCGDVTHLKKDCPKYQAQQQKQEESLTIETLGPSNPDSLEEEGNNISGNTFGNKRPNKVVKF